jgi:hypothetical protein
MSTVVVGALCFGIVIGWMIYRTLPRRGETVQLSDIAAVGGGWVATQLSTPELFAWYCFGLFIGFFSHLILAVTAGTSIAWLGGNG